MKTSEIREKTEAQLLEEQARLRAALYDGRFRREVEQVADPTEARKSRRDLARVLTVLRERELGRVGGRK
ncbi:MAG: 50S ribosomal protein L29 [Planctomycetales bacterium]|nr:50S ribosomal protein L29 [Planctomycetales bacterium]